MVFCIFEGKPYALRDGVVYPCSIFLDGYRVGETPVDVKAEGYLSEIEVKAKLGFNGTTLTSEVEESPVPAKTKKK